MSPTASSPLTAENHTTSEPRDMPIGDLVGRLSNEIASLIHDEIRLAQAEMTQKAKTMGVGAGIFGGSGLLVVFGLGAVIAAAIVGLSLAVALWAAALIVGGILFLLAGVAALMGKKEFSKASLPIPTEAITSSRKDIGSFTQGLRS